LHNPEFKKICSLILFLAAFLGSSIVARTDGGYRLTKEIRLPGNSSWDLVTADAVSRRLYVTHGTLVQVVDLDSGTLVGTIPDLDGVHDVAIAPDLNRGYITNGNRSTLTCFALDTLKKIAEIPTGKSPDADVYDPATHQIFAFNETDHTATVVDASTNVVVATMPLAAPEAAVVDGQGKLYLNLPDDNQIAEIDTQRLTVLHRWKTAPGTSPTGLAIDTKNHLLFVGCRSKRLVILSAFDGRYVADFPIGDHVDSTAFDPKTSLVFNSNGDGTLNIVREASISEFTALETVTTKPGARTLALDLKTGAVYLPVAGLKIDPQAAKLPGHHRPQVIPETFELLQFTKN